MTAGASAWGTAVRPPVLAPSEMPPVTEAIRSIPLGTRQLVSMALDLLTRSDAGLRSASFYIGFVMLLAAGPLVVLFGLVWLTYGDQVFAGDAVPGAWAGWLGLSVLPASLGYIAASVDARALAVAVIGGRAEGRPLRLAESIAVVRLRFWRVLGAQLVIGVITTVATWIASQAVNALVGPVEAIDFGVSLFVGVVAGAPFVYVATGIVLGEVGVADGIRRSILLVRVRPRLAVVVALFGVLSQFIVVFGLSIGLDALLRVEVGAGLQDGVPAVLAIPVGAALVFSLGTLMFLVEAIAAAPAVYAFAALTRYTRGLEWGRRKPLPTRHPWEPYLTLPLAIGTAIGLIALLGGILSLRA